MLHLLLYLNLKRVKDETNIIILELILGGLTAISFEKIDSKRKVLGKLQNTFS